MGKKNRSSGQLSKMTRNQSAKNLVKAGAKSHVKFKRSASHLKLNKLDDDDHRDGVDWEEDESITTKTDGETQHRPKYQRAITEPAPDPTYVGSFMGVPVTDQQLLSDKGIDPELAGPSPGTSLISPRAQISSHYTSKSPRPNDAQVRGLNRNVSFATKLTVSQTPEPEGSSSDTSGEHAVLQTSNRQASPRVARDSQKRDPQQSEESDEDDDEASPPHSEIGEKSKTENPHGATHMQPSESISSNMRSPVGQQQGDSMDTDTYSVKDDNQTLEPTEPRHIGKEKQSEHGDMDEQAHLSDSSPVQEEQHVSSEEENSVEMKARANTQNMEFHTSAQDPVSMPAHDIPISRTQFRLNLERQHTMTLREPRQRPSHWPSFDSGSGEQRQREIELITGRISVPRAVREARRELKTINERGHDPLRAAVDVALNKSWWKDRTIELNERGKAPIQKVSSASGKKPAVPVKAQPKPVSSNSPAFTLEERAAFLDTFADSCRRLWNTPEPDRSNIED